MKLDSSLRFAAIAGLVVALLIGLVALVVRPDEGQRAVSSTRSGVFEYRGGGARYSSLSTLDGRAVPCVASVLRTQYNCHLAPHGARVSIDFAEVPTALGSAEMAIAVKHDGQLIYALNGSPLSDRWFSASLWDAFFFGVVASLLAYVGSVIRAHFSKGK